MLTRKLMIVLLTLACMATTSATFAADAKPSADKLIAVLKSADASQKDKNDACRELAAIGDPKAIPVLVGLLGDKKMAHMARYALEPIGGDAVDSALRDAAGKLKGILQVGVINSIGVRRDAKAVELLTKLAKDADKEVASAAIGAMGRIATPKAITALAECRKAPPAALRWAVADASMDVAESLLKADKTNDAIAIYIELEAEAWPPQVRLGAYSALVDTDTDRAPDRIAGALTGDDPVTRSLAISKIPALDGAGVSKRFAGQLPALPPAAQAMLIDALAGRGDPAALGAIVKAASHDNAKVRTAAIRALGGLGDADCVKLLCDTMIGGKTDAEKQAAQSSLRALGAEEVDAALTKRMSGAKTETLIDIINILVDRKSDSATSTLLGQASAKDPKVRSAALRGLGRIAAPKDLPAILKILVKAEDDATRREAELAAVSVSRRIANRNDRADDVLAAMKTADTTPAKRSLIAVLGGIANKKALRAVKGALGSKNPGIYDAAVRALAAWPNENASNLVLGVFLKTKNKTHRALTLRGLVRILSKGGVAGDEALAVYENILKNIDNPNEHKLVLSGLGNIASVHTFKVIEPLLSNKSVRQEAELAYLKVAQSLISKAPKQAKAAAKKLQKGSKNAGIRRKAGALLR